MSNMISVNIHKMMMGRLKDQLDPTDMQNDIARLTAHIVDQEDKIKKLESLNGKEFQDLSKEVSRLTFKLGDTEGENAKLHVKIENLIAEISDLQVKNIKLTTELNHSRSSMPVPRSSSIRDKNTTLKAAVKELLAALEVAQLWIDTSDPTAPDDILIIEFARNLANEVL